MKKRLQRAVSCLMLCALLISGMAAPASAAGFTDVPASHWAASSIQRCVELGFFQGETATRFGLGHQMTRAAFVVVLGRFFGWKTEKVTKSTYGDVPANAWYAGAVEAAYANGAVTLQSGDFRPEDPWKFFQRSKEHTILNDNTARLLESMLVKLKDEGEDAAFAYIRRDILGK